MRSDLTGLSRTSRPCSTRRNGTNSGQKIADHVDQNRGHLNLARVMPPNPSPKNIISFENAVTTVLIANQPMLICIPIT